MTPPDDNPPRFRWWIVPLAVAVLRALPFLATLRPPSDPSLAWLPVGYLPKDLLAYVAFLRQVPDQGAWLFENPFTTAPQGGRFILLFHLVVGGISALTHLDPFLALELSRIPLLFAFFWVVWRFCGAVLPDPRHRRWAYVLVAFSGGLEFPVKVVAAAVESPVQGVVLQDLWHLSGWSTFAALFNPLWVAGLTLLLLGLRPLLQPRGIGTAGEGVRVAASFLVLWFTHPYSAMVMAAVAAARPGVEWAFRRPEARRNALRTALWLGPPAAVIGLVTLWQLGDPVFARSTGGTLGPQDLSVFWYPVTLALVGWFALLGARRMVTEAHPWRFALAAWLVTVVFLHTSPVLNGYHFVPYLHLPLCLVAAPALADTVRRLAARRSTRGGLEAAALMAGLFLSTLTVTWESLFDASRRQLVPRARLEVAGLLADLPPGGVLAPPEVGIVVPAYGPQKVWQGHWFLTPDPARRANAWAAFLQDPLAGGEPQRAIREGEIDYVVAPAGHAPRIADALGPRVARSEVRGGLALFVLADPGR